MRLGSLIQALNEEYDAHFTCIGFIVTAVSLILVETTATGPWALGYPPNWQDSEHPPWMEDDVLRTGYAMHPMA